MAAVLAAAILTSVAAAAADSGYFSSVFKGETSYIADFVKTDKKSVEDDRFRLTLEQHLICENRAMLICSIEAKTADAVKEMNATDENGRSEFGGMNFLTFEPSDSSASLASYSYGSLDSEKFNTESKRYYVLKCDNIENSENTDFYLSTDRIKDAPKITVSMDYDIETKTVQLGGMTVSYNPISIDVTLADMAEDMCAECDWNGAYLYFRMKDGEIKTFNQLYKYSGKDSTSISAWARGIIEPDEIQSIIANGAEYPVSDSSAVKAVKIDKTLKPFVMKPYIKYHLWLPLREFCENIGAETTWRMRKQARPKSNTAALSMCSLSAAQRRL